MPICQITTNIGDDKMGNAWIEKFSNFVTAMVDRSPDFINVQKIPVTRAYFAGRGPFIQCRMWGTMFHRDVNREWGPIVIKYLMDQLGLAEDRIVVTFHGIDKSEVAVRNLPVQHPLFGK